MYLNKRQTEGGKSDVPIAPCDKSWDKLCDKMKAELKQKNEQNKKTV